MSKAADRAMAKWQAAGPPVLQNCIYCQNYVEVPDRWRDWDGTPRNDLHQVCGNQFRPGIINVGDTIVAVRPDRRRHPMWGKVEDVRVEVRRLGHGLDTRTRIAVSFEDADGSTQVLMYSPEQVVAIPADRKPYDDRIMEDYWRKDQETDAEYRWWMADSDPNKSRQFQPITYID